MKKIILASLMFVSLSTFAQKEMNLTPEQSAELRTKEMTLKLDLTEQQERKVYAINKEIAEKRSEMRKVDRKALSDDERYEMRLARLDEMIGVKKEMKTILNEQQYEKWESTMKLRGKKMQKECMEKRYRKEVR